MAASEAGATAGWPGLSQLAALQLKPVNAVAQNARLVLQLIEAGGEGRARDEPHEFGLRQVQGRCAERGGRWERPLSGRTWYLMSASALPDMEPTPLCSRRWLSSMTSRWNLTF
eukprot:scaffold107362_cov48-Phaeocystis_antarctica.AAC.1